MLPLTKSQPKEMLPVFNKPAIQYVVEEAAYSGIDDILIITGKGKRAIEDHFNPNLELENFLKERGKHDDLKKIESMLENVDIFYIRQKRPRGLGDAIMYAEKHIGKGYFSILLGDDVIFSDIPAIKQLQRLHEKYGCAVVGVEKVRKEELSRYGVVSYSKRLDDGLFDVDDIVEKPEIDNAPSEYAVIGRYIVGSEIFSYLKEVKPDRLGEIQLTDALKMYVKEHRILALELKGKRVDIGSMEGWLYGNIFALKMFDKGLYERLKNQLL